MARDAIIHEFEKTIIRAVAVAWVVFLLALALAVFLPRPCKAGDNFETSPKEGVSIVGKHLVEERELWAITWPEPVQELERRGGMKMRAEMRENWADYVLAVLYLDDGVWFSFTRDDTLVLCYGDSLVASSECLVAGDMMETTLYRASRNELYFDDTWNPTTKSGGYLLAFRFNENSLPRGGQWGFERPNEAYIEGSTR